ncbi:MAG: hypothetical protein ACTHJK_12750 [Sphingomicrobium sp.]|jgi:hypothetical protein
MTGKKSDYPDDKTARERRKDLSAKEIEDLELAGGVEGGMQAGSAGGPAANGGKKDAPKERSKSGK